MWILLPTLALSLDYYGYLYKVAEGINQVFNKQYDNNGIIILAFVVGVIMDLVNEIIVNKR